MFVERIPMRRKGVLAICATVCLLGSNGCSTHLKLPSVYETVGSSVSRPILDLTVTKIRYVDARDTELETQQFFLNPRWSVGHGYFDRSVQDIVTDAVKVELTTRSVKRISKGIPRTTPTLELECRVDHFDVTVRKGDYRQQIMSAKVSCTFRWLDPKTGQIENESTQSEERETIRFSYISQGRLNYLNTSDMKALEFHGNLLVQQLLPRVLHKELDMNQYLRQFAKEPSVLVKRKQDRGRTAVFSEPAQ